MFLINEGNLSSRQQHRLRMRYIDNRDEFFLGGCLEEFSTQFDISEDRGERSAGLEKVLRAFLLHRRENEHDEARLLAVPTEIARVLQTRDGHVPLENGRRRAHDRQPRLIVRPVGLGRRRRLQRLGQDSHWKERANREEANESDPSLPRSLTNNACLISWMFRFSRWLPAFVVTVWLSMVVSALGVASADASEGDVVCLMRRRMISSKSPMDVSCTSSSTSAL